MTNPFDNDPFAQAADAAEIGKPEPEDTLAADFGREPFKPRPPREAPGYKAWDGKQITEAGAYAGVDADDYHGREICPSPSISSTGLKKMTPDTERQRKGCTPRHFWESSMLNPNRRPTEDTDALRFGRFFHDAVLLPERWNSDHYHFLPDGFSRAKTKAMAQEIAEADAAIEAGKECVDPATAIIVNAMAAAVHANKLASSVLRNADPEMTIAWPDERTGVWCRARPDLLPHKRQIITDLKSASDASYSGFQSDIKKYGYAQSAALQLDGIEAIFGNETVPAFLHLVVEKPGPNWRPGDYIPVALWELPAEDIERGRWLNRRAINVFAECLKRGTDAEHWPGYADQPTPCGLPGWDRKTIDEGVQFDGIQYQQKGWMETPNYGKEKA